MTAEVSSPRGSARIFHAFSRLIKAFPLTPCFSWVWTRRMTKNRFNGLSQAVAPAVVSSLAMLTCSLLLTGCAYTVGPVNGVIAKDKSVQVNPFINQPLEPHLTDAVTAQLRKHVQ